MVQILKKERRKRIERAALDEFLEKGFNNASMRNIAQNAQLSTSNLYNYFESKEKLFYEIMDEMYRKINNLFLHLTSSEREIGIPLFFDQVTSLIAKPIGELIKKHRTEFLILLERSQGSKYENFYEELTEAVEKHFIQHLLSDKHTQTKELENTFIMHILARNLLEGLLEISRHYENDEWVDYNINALMKYHVVGISQFFE